MAKRSLLFVFIAAFGAHFALASGQTTQAGQDTHMDVQAEDMVTLLSLDEEESSECFEDELIFYRHRPGGVNVSIDQFEVPFAHLLVITDVHWVASPISVEEPHGVGGGLSLAIWIRQRDESLRPVFRSTSFEITEANKNALFSRSTHMTSGFVVAPGEFICPAAFSNKTTSGGTSTDIEVTLHGYLIDNPTPKPRPTLPN